MMSARLPLLLLLPLLSLLAMPVVAQPPYTSELVFRPAPEMSDNVVQAQSQAPTPLDYCNRLAAFAEAVVADRNNGFTLRQSVNALRTNVPTTTNTGVFDDLYWVVRMVYDEPFLPPAEEAGFIFESCWQAYGG